MWSTAFAHTCRRLWWVSGCRHIKRFTFYTILPPSALHPQPRCFYWNPPPFKAQHTVRGSLSTAFHIVFGFQNLWVHLLSYLFYKYCCVSDLTFCCGWDLKPFSTILQSCLSTKVDVWLLATYFYLVNSEDHDTNSVQLCPECCSWADDRWAEK